MRKLVSIVIVSLAAQFVLATAAIAAEPELSKDHLMRSSGYSWRLNRLGPSQILSIFKINEQRATMQFDISGCLFCAGEDDNCERDGVVGVKLAVNPYEPVVAVICHVGAHSQRIRIYAPWRNSRTHVFSITGDFSVDYEITSEGISGRADYRGKMGNALVRRFSWQ